MEIHIKILCILALFLFQIRASIEDGMMIVTAAVTVTVNVTVTLGSGDMMAAIKPRHHVVLEELFTLKKVLPHPQLLMTVTVTAAAMYINHQPWMMSCLTMRTPVKKILFH